MFKVSGHFLMNLVRIALVPLRQQLQVRINDQLVPLYVTLRVAAASGCIPQTNGDCVMAFLAGAREVGHECGVSLLPVAHRANCWHMLVPAYLRQWLALG